MRLVLACAATAVLTIFASRLLWTDPGAGDRLRVKGTSRVWVYWERDGDVLPWTKDVDLQNGDRVRAEVLASSDVVGYLAVVNGDGLLLSSPDRMAAGAVRVAAGEKRTFPGSIKLVGQAEGERLVVILCERPAGGDGPDLTAAIPGQGQPLKLLALPDACGAEEFPLRGGQPSKP